jgi:peptidoglycan/xylan/chitin deacetylase (PgdA/CDA1 family)
VQEAGMSYRKYFTLSFDDGMEQDKILIAHMKQYGLKGTFNLSAGMFGYSPRYTKLHVISADEAPQVYEGFEVASHGYLHENFRWKSASRVENSLTRDISKLSELFGTPIVGHAYPYDARTKTAERILKAHGIHYARRAAGKGSFRFPENPMNYTPTCWFNAKNVMALLDEFIRAEPVEDDLLFMMWGHSHEMDYGLRKCSKAQLGRIFAKIAVQPNIIYCTNKEAFERIKD